MRNLSHHPAFAFINQFSIRPKSWVTAKLIAKFKCLSKIYLYRLARLVLRCRVVDNDRFIAKACYKKVQTLGLCVEVRPNNYDIFRVIFSLQYLIVDPFYMLKKRVLTLMTPLYLLE